MTTKRSKSRKGPTHEVLGVTESTLDEVEQVLDATEQHFEQVVSPIRKNIFKRFPIVSILMVTFGVTATVLGMERILLQYDLLQERPIIILAIGLGILTLAGALYKKLG